MEAMTVTEIEQFKYELELNGMSVNTVRAYGSDLNSFLIWSLNFTPAVTSGNYAEFARKYLNHLREDAKATTVRRAMASLRRFARFQGFDSGLAEYKAPTAATPKPHPVAGGMDSVRAMLAVTKAVNKRALIALQGFGGLRVSEARSVRPMDLNRERGTVSVRGKGDKVRIVQFDTDSTAWKAILEAADLVSVPTDSIVNMPDRTARYTITAAAKKAGVTHHVKSHDMRATAATGLYGASGHNIRLVQDFLGHASVKQTQIYTEVSEDALMAAVKAL